eukprot:9772673-Lingulodinium_polyedra.AAC.1
MRGADGAQTCGALPQHGRRCAAVAPVVRDVRPRVAWHHLRGGWRARPGLQAEGRDQQGVAARARHQAPVARAP